MTSKQFNGNEKAAIMLIALGPEKSAKIFKYLNDEEIEELTLQIANMRTISSKEKEKILEDFYQLAVAQE